ncbi:hypothetical protein [Tropicibacter alexandrii]|uniref:hypothetical protein n=1 Tax=Tropicibacter alexandrii TaxID=2267683 RepID=UPI000EF50E71|nr:hypothetical protein [Tropicibacter alexandrii]
MGLGITVGILADLMEHDPDGCADIQRDMAAINRALENRFLPLHTEPETCAVWWADGYGYSGLHALRAVAALHWMGQPIPRNALLNGDDMSAEERLFDAYMVHLCGPAKVGRIGQLLRRAPKATPCPTFAHLVAHSDAEGYYVPVDFPVPITPHALDGKGDHIWPLGSVPRLKAELDTLADLLDVPDGLEAEGPELTALIEQPQVHEDCHLWRAQPIATHSLLILREACARSLATGAAISFG